ncbi:hypothetical protein BGC07_10150 [Piscirickettsia litoralis]|uniref:Uncharacterized protein n=1 Tax=Piscirickettsia litoralis TaxID=1891921 RepID=A0ABX3AAQ8_9GAMM|nr:hypothetical protein BGC07_10150 [Piscirickettsia litoralis]
MTSEPAILLIKFIEFNTTLTLVLFAAAGWLAAQLVSTKTTKNIFSNCWCIIIIIIFLLSYIFNISYMYLLISDVYYETLNSKTNNFATISIQNYIKIIQVSFWAAAITTAFLFIRFYYCKHK